MYYLYHDILSSIFFVNILFWFLSTVQENRRPSWPWSYGSWIYNYLWNQCLSPLMLWVRISIRARCTTLCDKVCQWLATGRKISLGPPISSTNKADCHDITEILLKVALNTIKENKQTSKQFTQNVLLILYYCRWERNYYSINETKQH
jgi:hypothetical protein